MQSAELAQDDLFVGQVSPQHVVKGARALSKHTVLAVAAAAARSTSVSSIETSVSYRLSPHRVSVWIETVCAGLAKRCELCETTIIPMRIAPTNTARST